MSREVNEQTYDLSSQVAIITGGGGVLVVRMPMRFLPLLMTFSTVTQSPSQLTQCRPTAPSA
jgi:hypothetical protein